MKTLQKLTLMAFAILSAGVANAQAPQCTNCTPPTINPPATRPEPSCRNCSLGPNSPTTRYAAQAARPANTTSLTPNQSAVFQQGTNQYACVEQLGYDNTADLVQDAGSATAAGRNDAYQTQRSFVGTIDNVLYGRQNGRDNLLVQNQNGYDNLGRAVQTGNGNLAAQDQGGASSTDHGNAAYVYQSSDNNASIQYQRGNDNTSDVYQHSPTNSNWAGTNQNGTSNVVSINQH